MKLTRNNNDWTIQAKIDSITQFEIQINLKKLWIYSGWEYKNFLSFYSDYWHTALHHINDSIRIMEQKNYVPNQPVDCRNHVLSICKVDLRYPQIEKAHILRK